MMGGVSVWSTNAAGLGGLFNRKSESHKARALHRKVETAVELFKEKDPGINKFFERSVGYAVFPTVVKAGFGIGGAGAKGEVYEGDAMIGTSQMSQATIGFQLGGQTYSEIVFFEDQETFEDFKGGTFEFSAQVSAVAVTLGASDNANFDQGLAVFTVQKGGLMYEASIGGQVFHFDRKP